MAFIRLLYGEGERVYFFPIMKVPEIIHKYEDARTPYPSTVGRVWISTCPSISTWSPPKRILPAISASVGSRTFSKTYDILRQLNELGYDMFLTPNPLTHKRRIKETVREIRYIVIESDDIPIPAQEAFLAMMKPNVRVAIFSGHRSLHIYIPLIHPIHNPECLFANQYREARIRPEENPDVVIPDFDDIVDDFKVFLSAHGYPYCDDVLSAFWGLTRCPCFVNHKSGNEASVVYSSTASNIGYINGLHTSGCELLELNEVGKTAWEGSGGLVPACVSPTLSPVESMVHSASVIRPPKEPNTPEVCQKGPYGSGERSGAEGHFLKDLATYEELRISGIRERHTRRSFHRSMFTATRLFDWTDIKLAQEWRGIVGINPNSIGLTVEDAVDDLLREWDLEKDRSFLFWKPDQKSLPDASQTHQNNVRNALNAWGCKRARTVSNTILKLLYPTIRKALIPCLRGTASISARSLWKVCNGYAYKEVLAWLHDRNILRLKDSSYIRQSRSRLWFVNVHLILFLMGFTEDDLTWNRTTRGTGHTSMKKMSPAEEWLEDVASSTDDWDRFACELVDEGSLP